LSRLSLAGSASRRWVAFSPDTDWAPEGAEPVARLGTQADVENNRPHELAYYVITAELALGC
jgi:hypothetical protein